MTNRNPIINATIGAARTPAAVPEHRVLIIGQSNDADVTSGALEKEIGNNETTIKDKFGAKEHVTQAILAFREENKVSTVDVIALNDNGSGVAATGTVVITGTATESGTLYISVGSENAHRLAIGVSSGDTATVIGDAIDDAVLADTTIPVTSNNVTGTVTFTSVNKGTIANDIGIKVEGSVAGVTSVAITAMSSGATDPVLTNLFDVIEDIRYDTIICPSYVSSSLATELDDRFNATNDVLDGVGVYCELATFADHQTALDLLSTRNIVYICNKLLNETDQKGGAILELPIVIAARVGAVRALRLTEGANIAKYMVNNITKGGVSLASVPYFNTPFNKLPLPPIGKNFTKSEISTLIGKNGTTLVRDATGTKVILNEVLVTISTNASNRLNFEETLRAIRATRFFRMKDRYSQSRLVGEGQERPGQPDVSISSFKADALEDWQYFVDNSLIRTTTSEGESTKEIFKEALDDTIIVNFLTGTITDEFLADIVTQLLRVDEIVIPSFN